MSDEPRGSGQDRRGEESDASGEESSSPHGKRADNLVGSTLAGRFEILEAIARGGMGVIYKATQQPLGRLCAIKVMRPTFDPEQTAEFHRRFFLEAATAAKLTHPNTVTIFDYGNEGELYFIAMEYIQGNTLRQVLQNEGPLNPGRAIHIAMEICRSLQEAHRLGVVHRDLKPENVVIINRQEDLDTIKVLDFGLVKSIKGHGTDTVTTGGLCVGSPSYMAPEQVDGDDVVAGTDIYSLGIVLYEMVCGRPPFVRNSKYALVMAHLAEEPPPMSDHIPADKIPRGLPDVVARCIAKKPADRYGGMEELLEEFRRIAEGKRPMTTTMRLRVRNDADAKAALKTGERNARREGSQPGDGPNGTSTAGSVLSVQPSQPEILPAPRKKPLMWVAVAFVALAVGGGVTHWAVRDDTPPTVVADSRASLAATAPSAPSVAADPVPASVAPPSPPRLVHVESEPSGAEVALGDRNLCKQTPCDVSLNELGPPPDGGLKLRVSLAGYEPTEVEVGTDRDKLVAKLTPLRLRPTGAPAAPPAGTKPSGDEGFKLSPY